MRRAPRVGEFSLKRRCNMAPIGKTLFITPFGHMACFIEDLRSATLSEACRNQWAPGLQEGPWGAAATAIYRLPCRLSACGPFDASVWQAHRSVRLPRAHERDESRQGHSGSLVS